MLEPTIISFKDYSLRGVSQAGIGTCITVPEWRVCFDVAQGLPFAFSMNHFLISHFHQDHAAGIPYLISQKAMQSHKPATFFLPPDTSEPLNRILKTWAELEDHSYEYHLQELEFGKRLNLHGNIYVESFQTKHRVRSQGYTLSVRNKKLSDQFKGLSRDKIIQLKERGENIEQETFLPKISFTGDTQIEFLDLAPDVVHSETLIMEVTYIDDKKGVESARKWGHTHFREVVERVPKIQSKNIIFIHLSARYSSQQMREMIRKYLPDDEHRISII